MHQINLSPTQKIGLGREHDSKLYSPAIAHGWLGDEDSHNFLRLARDSSDKDFQTIICYAGNQKDPCLHSLKGNAKRRTRNLDKFVQ